MRHHNLQVTGSVVVNGLGLATTADLNTYTASTDAKISTLQAFTASVGTTNTFTASASGRLNSIETISASNIARINAIEIVTSSNVARLNALETTSASVDTLNSTQNTRLTNLEEKTGSLASTGSNTFIGTQTITGSLYISSDLIVQGSSSLQNITASAVSIGTNIINLNTANPAIRYAGLVIGDSGSIGSSGSFLYDSVQDEFIFVHRGANSTVTSSVVLMGPQTYDSIGSESYLTNNRITKGTGNEHLVDSNITDIGSSIGIGITNPTYPLTRNGMTFKASGTDGAEFVMLSSTDTGFVGGALVRNGMDFAFVNRTSGSVIFATNATERMFINSAGNVGIGITNPTRKLDIVATGEQLRLSYDGSTTYTDFRNDSAGGLLVNTSAEYIIHYIAGSPIMRMTANGRVGISTTSPTGILDVWGDGSTDIIKATRSSVTRFVVKNGTNTVGINTDTVNSALTVNGNVDMVGNVGINTTTAYSPLTLKGGNISWGETVTMYPSPSGYITLALRLEGADSTTGTWAIGKESSSSIAAGTPEYLQIVKNGLSGGALHRVDAVQSWAPNGNALFGFKVGIGTTNPSDTLHVIGSSRWGTAGNNLVSYADGGGVYMELTGANSNQRQLRIQGINNSANRYSSIRLEAGIEEIAFNTADLERMRIRSNGAVTRAYQPAFLAYSENSGFTVTANGWYNISNALTQESYDIGSNYNASNGRFTAPVAGRYFFYAGGWAQIGSASNGERYAFCARVNDGALTFIGGGNYCIGDTPLSGYTLVCNLAASDFVDLWVFSAVTGTWGSGSHRTYWGGYLL